MTQTNVFIKQAMDNMPRLLSLMDRTPISQTYGCFDRFYWHYKKSDIPLSSIQSGVYSLALVYSHKLTKNPYYQNKNVLGWTIAGIRFWCSLQNRNGSFDDYYPNEQSYIATALATYPIAKTIYTLKEHIAPMDLALFKKTLDKACVFLSKNKEHSVANQEAMACLAIYYSGLVLGNNKFKKVYQRKISDLLQLQNVEGWFPEYSGTDTGYLSAHIDAFATLYNETNDSRIYKALSSMIQFFSFFCHPDYTVGGEYTTRGTEYVLPSGFVKLDHPVAAGIYSFIKEGLSKGKGFSINLLDYRYLPIYHFHYLEAGILDHSTMKPLLPYQLSDFEIYFESAGLFVKKMGNQYLIVGVKKGGVFKLFDTELGKLVLSHSGFYVKKSNNYLVSAYYNENTAMVPTKTGFKVTQRLTKVKDVRPTPFNHLVLRVINIVPFLAGPLREIIKKLFITKKHISKNKVVVCFDFSNGFCFTSFINDNKHIPEPLDRYVYGYTPSSKYFNQNDLLEVMQNQYN